MKAMISASVLAKDGLTLKDFGILLYYVDGGTGDICPEITEMLWKKNLLTKMLDGYSYNPFQNKKVQDWIFASTPKLETGLPRFKALADKLREIYPSGMKDGRYSWRDNTMTIAKKLVLLQEKFQSSFTDEEAIEATKKYVESFRQRGDFTYMQLLKYFILKRDNERGEETSTLLTLIQNKDDVPQDFFGSSYDTGELR